MLRALSLTQRLTIFFTVLASVVLFGLGQVFIQAAEQHFVDQDHSTLQGKQHLIEGVMRSASSAEDIQLRLNEALSHHHDLYVVVNDAQGGMLYRSRDFRLPGWVQTSESPPTDVPALRHWTSDGKKYRAIVFRVVPAYESNRSLDVLAAIDIRHHEHFLTGLRRTLLWYALCAIAVSSLLGWVASHQGLAPLRAMRTKAAAVSGHQFSERMPVAAVPIEMADLATELNGMLDRLRDDYRRLAEFSSDLAHELRTPISNLLTQTQVALSTKRDAPTYRTILASNAEELECMARMVADMLFLAKAERDMELPNREHFSAAQEVQALLEFYDAVAEEKGIQLSVTGNGEIDGDRLMFRRAVSNLLSNAVRHGDPGSPVAVKIGASETGVSVRVANTAEDRFLARARQGPELLAGLQHAGGFQLEAGHLGEVAVELQHLARLQRLGDVVAPAGPKTRRAA